MPNDKDIVCIKKGKITYCWNFETCQLEIYSKKVGKIYDCPKDIVNELMELINNKVRLLEEQNT